MNRYTVTATIGDLQYGTIFKGVHKESGDNVVIKHFKKKFYSWQECKFIFMN
jgi:protein kinase